MSQSAPIRSINNNSVQEFRCDRRTSRAAVELVRRLLEPYVVVAAASSSSRSMDDWLSMTPSESCVLHPDRNVYRSLGYTSIQPMRKYSFRPSERQHEWFQCALCGKAFVSQYYMDVHLERKHTSTVWNDSDTRLVCPAISYCDAFDQCLETALVLEPYYGRGSGDARSQYAIQAAWKDQVESVPCNETHLSRVVQSNCRRVLQDCFGGNYELPLHTLQQSICASFTCAHRLHARQLVKWTSRSNVNPAIWGHLEQEWKHYASASYHLAVGWKGWTAVASVVVVVLWCWIRERRYNNTRPTATQKLSSQRRSKPSLLSMARRLQKAKVK